jgi:hypothetical protein
MAGDEGLLGELLALEAALDARDPGPTGRDYADLLHPDAEELGSSGRRWDRAGLLSLLASAAAVDVRLRDASASLLGPGVALLTYMIDVPLPEGGKRSSLRSSVFLLDGGRWRLRFHQGTPIPVSS